MQRININLLPAHIIEQLLKKNSSALTSSLQEGDGDNETDRNMDKNLDAKHSLAYAYCINQLKKTEINYGNLLPDKLHCECVICHAESEKMKIEHIEEIKEKFFEDHDFEKDAKHGDTEKDFVYIMKRLMPVKNILSSLRLNVPDTVAFVGGEPKYRVSTGQDKTLKFTRQKEKLTLQEINKLFQARFRSCQVEVSPIDEEVEPSTPTKTMKKGTLTDIDSAYSTILDRESRHHTKKYPLYRNGTLRDPQAKNELALAKFNDNSTRTLCENEFEQIITKRKCDGFWKTLQYLQVFARTRASIQTMKRVYFVYDRDRNKPLFARARIEILFLNGEDPTSEGDYFTTAAEEKFEASLLENDESEYYSYLLMKIFHFLDVVHGVKITKMCGEFLREEKGIVWLFNICRLQYIQSATNVKEEAGGGLIGLLAPLKSKKLSVALEGYFKNLERMQAIKILNKALQQEYKYVRNKGGVQVPEYYYGDNISDEIFAKIHPNAPFKLSDMIRKEVPYDKIQEFLHNNADKLKSFQQYMYDGKDTKIPVRKSFNTENTGFSTDRSFMNSKGLQKSMTSNRSSLRATRTKETSPGIGARIPSVPNLSQRALSVPRFSSGESMTEKTSLNISAKSFRISINGSDQVEFDATGKHSSGNIDDLTLVNPTSTAREKTSHNDSVSIDPEVTRENFSCPTKSLPSLLKISRARSTTQARKSSSNQLSVLDARRYSELKAKVEDKNSTSGYTRYVVSKSLPYILALQTKALSEKFLG